MVINVRKREINLWFCFARAAPVNEQQSGLPRTIKQLWYAIVLTITWTFTHTRAGSTRNPLGTPLVADSTLFPLAMKHFFTNLNSQCRLQSTSIELSADRMWWANWFSSSFCDRLCSWHRTNRRRNMKENRSRIAMADESREKLFNDYWEITALGSVLAKCKLCSF